MIDYDPTLVGRVFEAESPIHVSAKMIADFCAAIGETNPLYTDGETAQKGPYGVLVAPPSYAAAFRDGDNISEQVSRYGTRRLAAGMDVDFVIPIRAGDSVTIVSSIKEVYEKTGRSGAMIFVVIRSTLKNQHGEVVAYIDHRFMNRP
ncbi:MAG: FAS1-like dehydratase domain-containing protein [Candidatus Binataceae bacterium]